MPRLREAFSTGVQAKWALSQRSRQRLNSQNCLFPEQPGQSPKALGAPAYSKRSRNAAQSMTTGSTGPGKDGSTSDQLQPQAAGGLENGHPISSCPVTSPSGLGALEAKVPHPSLPLDLSGRAGRRPPFLDLFDHTCMAALGLQTTPPP